ncbi:MAG: SCO family protein [Acidobacteriota bacterium]
MIHKSLLPFAFCFLLFAFPVWSFAQRSPFSPPETQPMRDGQVPGQLQDITIEQRLDTQVPLDLPLRDEQGKAVRLGDYFGKRPVVLALVYYTCPMLCNQILNGVAGSLKTLSFDAGKEFEVVAVSFDPRDLPETANAKKQAYLERYNRKGTENGWHFLTGEEASVKALADTVGFNYRWDEASQQYIHASAIMVLTPQGKLSKYFYGIEYSPRDLKLGLVEASEGKIGTAVDQFYLFCFHYDPATGKYGVVIMNIIRLLGGVTFVGVAVLIFFMRRRRHLAIV